MHDADAQPRPPLRSFGRRRARKLSARQSELLDAGLDTFEIDFSRPPPEPLTALFSPETQDVWLEIGFGGGEHLVWQAEQHPNVGLIGAEPFIDGVVKVVDAIRRADLANIRLHADDVRDLLPWLPPASIGRVFILFPDPWPKKRHVKRRLVQAGLIEAIERVLRPGGELRLATDIDDYARQMLRIMHARPGFTWLAESASDWRLRPADWPGTRYESKAIREGRPRYFLRYRRENDRSTQA